MKNGENNSVYSAKLRRLQLKEQELESSFESLQESFRRQGLQWPGNPTFLNTINSRNQANNKKTFIVNYYSKQQVHASGIRMRNKLSFRGKEKAAEYFEYLANDRMNANPYSKDFVQNEPEPEKYLNYDVMRGVHAFQHPQGFVSKPSYQSKEAWLAHMVDMGFIPQQTPYDKEEQYVDQATFIKYRVMLEESKRVEPINKRLSNIFNTTASNSSNNNKTIFQPISTELAYHDLHLLPMNLMRWREMKQLIGLAEELREYRKLYAAPSIDAPPMDKDYLALDDMLFVTQVMHRNYTKSEFLRFMGVRAWKEKMHRQLLRYSARRHVSQPDYAFQLDANDKLVTNDEQLYSPAANNTIRNIASSNSNSRANSSGGSTSKAAAQAAAAAAAAVARAQALKRKQQQRKKMLKQQQRLTSEDTNYSTISQFTAWLLTCPVNISPNESIYRSWMRWKYNIYKGVRYLDSVCRWLFTFAGHLNDRLVFRDFLSLSKLSRNCQETTTLKLSCTIGNPDRNSSAINETGSSKANAGNDNGNNMPSSSGSFNNGIGLNWKLLKIDNMPALLKRLQAPSAVGTILYMDFLYRAQFQHIPASSIASTNHNANNDTNSSSSNQGNMQINTSLLKETTNNSVNIQALKEEIEENARNAPLLTEMEVTMSLMKQYINHHFEKELKGNPNFHSIQIFNTINELDDCKVLRIMFMYRKISSLDRLMEYILLPYQLTDLVATCVGDWKSNFDIHELIHTKINSLEELFASSFSCTVIFRKNLLIAIAERLILACSSAITQAQATFALYSKSKLSNTDETLNNTNTNNNSSTNSNNNSRPTTANSSRPGTAATDSNLDTLPIDTNSHEEENLRYERWQRVSQYYPQIVHYCSQFIDYVSSWKNISIRYQFNSILDLYDKLHSTVFDSNSYLRGIVQCFIGKREYLSEPGYIRRQFTDFAKRYYYEYSIIFERCKKHLEKKKQEEDEQRLRALLTINNKYVHRSPSRASRSNSPSKGKRGGKINNEDDTGSKQDDETNSTGTTVRNFIDQSDQVFGDNNGNTNNNSPGNGRKAANQRKKLLAKLQRKMQGVSSSNMNTDTENSDEENEGNEEGLDLLDSQLAITKAEEEQNEQEVLLLRLLETLSSNMTSFHAMELISGKYKVTLLTQGCDFFEIMPNLADNPINGKKQSMRKEYDKNTSKKKVFTVTTDVNNSGNNIDPTTNNNK